MAKIHGRGDYYGHALDWVIDFSYRGPGLGVKVAAADWANCELTVRTASSEIAYRISETRYCVLRACFGGWELRSIVLRPEEAYAIAVRQLDPVMLLTNEYWPDGYRLVVVPEVYG
jgi:hypothetical protein